jgi:hypothetical protein
MSRRLCLVAFALAAIAPVSAQEQPPVLPVHMTLKVIGDRKSFLSGEPIRLSLELVADRPGYAVDSTSLDEGSDIFEVAPDSGVFRVPNKSWRDVVMYTKLSETPTKLDLVANYWIRFDQTGDYTVRFRTNRVHATIGDDDSSGNPILGLSSNPVTFHVSLPTDAEEQHMLGDAMTALRNTSSASLDAEIHAAEQLAFLPGDVSAVQKYRERQRVCGANMPNACDLLRRGFFMTRHPGLIVEAIEADLADVSKTATTDMVGEAAALRLLMEAPEAYRQLPALPMPFADDPLSVRTANYLRKIQETLPARAGAAKLGSALTILTMSRPAAPADVTAFVVENFSQLSASDQQWLVGSYWRQIRSPRLAPVLLQLLPKVDPYARLSLVKSLVDLSPAMAREAVQAELRDPASPFGTMESRQLLTAFADDAFRDAGPALVALIRSSLESSKTWSDEYRIETKASLLPAVVGPELLSEVRSIYGRFGDKLKLETTAYFLAYFLRWDPENSAGVIEVALRSDPNKLTEMLSRITETAYSPRIDLIVKEQLLATDARAAAAAASVLSKWGQAQDRQLIEDRLEQWQTTLRSRPPDRTTEYDSFEQQFVAALVNSKRWVLTAADRDRLLASCLTEQCRSWLRSRK